MILMLFFELNNIQVRKMREEKGNPFHGRSTFKIARKSCIQNLKIPLALSSFVRETDFIFRSWVLSFREFV